MSTHFVGYDIIGDIHGCADALERLLSALGYIKSLNGYVYHDPDKPRQVVFLGDILDRGPKIRQAVQIVRAMVDNGQAQIVMGNHEYNALSCTAGVHADATHSDPLTVHRGHACYNVLIQKTIEQYADYVDEWIDTLQWLYTLPLFLEFEHFRVVHACWDQALVDQFRDRYGRATVDAAFVLEAQQSGSFAHQVVNRLMRGISLRLPDNMTITSSEGFVRRNFRVKFWEAEPVYYGDVEFQPDHLSAELARCRLSASEKNKLVYYDPQQPALFIGHYWLAGKPAPQTSNIACLDYSAVEGGRLVAYRFDNETCLSADKFVWVDGC